MIYLAIRRGGGCLRFHQLRALKNVGDSLGSLEVQRPKVSGPYNVAQLTFWSIKLKEGQAVYAISKMKNVM